MRLHTVTLSNGAIFRVMATDEWDARQRALRIYAAAGGRHAWVKECSR